MDYNDIIIITLLVIIIGLMLLKNNNGFFTTQDNFFTPQIVQKPQIHIPHPNDNTKFYNRENNNFTSKNIKNNQKVNNKVNINNKLNNAKKYKDNSPIILKNNSTKHTRRYEEETFASENNSDVFKDELNSLDMTSLDDIKISQDKKNKILTSSTKKNKIIVNNENIKNKVIIDDYSDFDNIKSLNSMDNTLSDIVSMVDKN